MGEKKKVLHFPAYKFTENVREKRLEMAFLKPYGKFKNFLGEHAPRPPPPPLGWATFGTTTFLPT